MSVLCILSAGMAGLWCLSVVSILASIVSAVGIVFLIKKYIAKEEKEKMIKTQIDELINEFHELIEKYDALNNDFREFREEYMNNLPSNNTSAESQTSNNELQTDNDELKQKIEDFKEMNGRLLKIRENQAALIGVVFKKLVNMRGSDSADYFNEEVDETLAVIDQGLEEISKI